MLVPCVRPILPLVNEQERACEPACSGPIHGNFRKEEGKNKQRNKDGKQKESGMGEGGGGGAVDKREERKSERITNTYLSAVWLVSCVSSSKYASC